MTDRNTESDAGAAMRLSEIARLEEAKAAVRTPSPLLVGGDNRVSTSKVVAFLWTVVVAYCVLTLGYISLPHFNYFFRLLGSFPGVYLVLLGGPFAAAVGATAIVTGSASRVQKAPADSSSLYDIFADDNSNLDLVDTQYALLNLVAAVVVVAQFVYRPGFGAPNIPGFLAALTGTSAATYLVNKGLSDNRPSLFSLQPAAARIGQQVAANGANLTAASATPASNTSVTVGGFSSQGIISASASQVIFTVPTPTNGQAYVNPSEVVITTNGGAVVTSQDTLAQLTVIADDPATLDHLDKSSVQANEKVVAFGTFLLPGSDLDWQSQALPTATGPAATLTLKSDNTKTTPLPFAIDASNSDTSLVYTIPDGLTPEEYTFSIDGVNGDEDLTVT